MTQAERRIFLIEKMLCEQPRYSAIEVPVNEQGSIQKFYCEFSLEALSVVAFFPMIF